MENTKYRRMADAMSLVAPIVTALEGVEGPPTTLCSLMSTCRTLRSVLSSKPLHAMIFRLKFDFDAPKRRLSLDDAGQATELHRRLRALKVIRTGVADDRAVTGSLYVAYLMLLEDDGKNAAQLQWAGFGNFLNGFLSRRVSDAGARAPADELNSLTIALVWQWTRLGHGDFDLATDCMKTFINSFLFADFCYDVPTPSRAPSPLIEKALTIESPNGTPHRHYTEHFGENFYTQAPPIAPYAVALYFALVERDKLVFRSGPPSREDVNAYNTACYARSGFFRSAMLTPKRSMLHEADWRRFACLFSPVAVKARAYRLGELSGSWEGTLVDCTYEHSRSCMSRARGLGPMNSRRALSLDLQEHYQYSTPPLSTPGGDIWDHVSNVPQQALLYFRPPPLLSEYCTRREGHEAMTEEEVSGVILSGSTMPVGGRRAWGAFEWRGRVRISDGLIVLVRRPAGSGAEFKARVLFVAYVLSSRHMVGRSSRGWVETADGSVCWPEQAPEPPHWDGAFSLWKNS